MKKLIVSAIILVSGLFIQPAAAQQHNFYSFTYSMGFSTGDFSDFIGQASFRGATFDYRRMVTDQIGVGVEFGWSAWYEEMDYGTYESETSTSSITGKQFRYCSTVPMLASANYFILPGEKFNPYAGLGLGTIFNSSELDMGVWAFTSDTWHFALKPEIGAVIELSPGVGAIISGKYYAAFETSESKSRNYITANVGIAWGF